MEFERVQNGSYHIVGHRVLMEHDPHCIIVKVQQVIFVLIVIASDILFLQGGMHYVPLALERRLRLLLRYRKLAQRLGPA